MSVPSYAIGLEKDGFEDSKYEKVNSPSIDFHTTFYEMQVIEM